MTRLLNYDLGTSSPAKRTAASTAMPNTPTQRSLALLNLAANPHLQLKILHVLSDKPASLTNAREEGAFITAGAAEKLVVTRCAILQSEDLPKDKKDLKEDGKGEHHGEEKSGEGGSTLGEREVEGLVIFSMTMHAKSSSTTALAQKQRQNASSTSRSEPQPDSTQSTISYPVQHNHRSICLPASVADLHSQLGEGEIVWVWGPWSVAEVQATESEGCETKKALIVSRFGVLV